MANELRNNHVWVVDTAHATNFVTQDNCFVKTIRWAGRVGTATIANAQDKVVWEAAAADSAPESYIDGLSLSQGFKVPTLGGGRLYIYLSAAGFR